MHCRSKLPKHKITKANSSPSLNSRNRSIDPFFHTKVADWLFKHFQTMEQIKEYSEIQKKCDKESYFDLVSLYNEDWAKQNTMTSSDRKVNRWLRNNFTTIKEIEKHNVKVHQRRLNIHFVEELIDRINISNAKTRTFKKIEYCLNKRIAKWMNYVPTEEIEELETEYGELSAAGSAKEEDGNAGKFSNILTDVYDGSEEDNLESNSELNSTILRLVDGLDDLGSASQHSNDINVSSDHSLLSSISQRSCLSSQTSYSSSDTSDWDLVFHENVEYYSKWLVKRKRNTRDLVIISDCKSTAL